MEPVYMDTDDTQKLAAEPLPFARSYQLEALEKALKQNTVLLLETGSGKTLVAIMLLRSYAHLLRKPSPFIAVFLVPQVVLVHQQAEAVESHTDLIVGKHRGEMGVDFRDAASWKQRLQKHEVLVMTPQILLDGLRHSFIKLDLIKVLIFDECHHTSRKHPYACILTEFYHCQLSFGNCNLPRIFGMTASPIKSKGAKSEPTYWPKIRELENMMHSKVYTYVSESVLAKFIPFSTPKFKFYEHMGVPNAVHVSLAEKLKILEAKYECHLKQLDLIDLAVESTSKKISKCILRPKWSIGVNSKDDVDAGLLTTKIFCLVDSLLEYRYFKPAPRCVIDKEREICTLLLPKSCPIETICVQGNIKTLKQKACLEACKPLHKIGALTDNLVPDCVEEEAVVKEVGNVPCGDEQPMYYPAELVSQGSKESTRTYYRYLIELNQNFDSDIPVHNIILLMRSELESNILSLDFDFELDRGRLTVKLKYIGEIDLTPEMVLICRKFLIALSKVLVDRNVNELEEILNGLQLSNDPEIDYLLLPSMGSCQKPSIDWNSIISVLFSHENAWKYHVNSPLKDCTRIMWTKNGQVCKCMLQNSLVYTPHNGEVYCIEGIYDHLDGRSLLKLKNGDYTSYKEYYKDKYDIELLFDQELLLRGRHIFPLHYYFRRCRQHKGKDSQNAYVELPPELCCIKMSPISISTFYSFTFVPSIMHRIESLLIAVNLKKMHLDHCTQNVVIPTIKVLEAITTKKCQEKFHLESLETLGDSFLKYAASQLLFKTYQKHHEGRLSSKKDKLISNDTLCKLGCDCKLPGFIRNESFDPKNWMVPGDASGNYSLREDFLSNARSLYITRRRKLKKKKVADVVEALIGAYLSAGGEIAALLFLNWIGIKRLEFLGDAVLDYLITEYLYGKYPGISPGLLTEMRSASVNNDCYARSAVREGLHKHILYTSQKLDKDIGFAVKCCENYSSESTFGWESEISFPKVLGDVMESLAGAIFVDSGYNKDVVFRSIRPLLEPLVTLETLRLNPTKELNELCQIKHFKKKNPFVPLNNGMSSVTVEVKANGVKFKHTSTAANKKTAEKLASKEVLRVLKEKFNI
ncbi:hypothetical protein GH714_043443 [Hevea brasiliensis]|uniref:Uncharacterized protein n=1 Tax=Hevea brasiliensis TaxID=3981 RepID=A0A6A6K6S0_HEVBR|nr:hypothetical protein GH714_043443 [Hevea brasiliensis]